MRSHESSKSDIYPEGVAVDGAGMSVEVGAHYPGRPAVRRGNDNPRQEARGHGRQESAEGIVGRKPIRLKA
jgi:hypothetical protein